MVAIVDDDVSICRSLKRLLSAHGVKAETFTSSWIFMEVVEGLPSFKPECVILDMHMPGFDGLEVQMRLASIRPGTPVLFLTSTYDSRVFKRAIGLGAVAFFQKPLHNDLDAFVNALRAILRIERPERT